MNAKHIVTYKITKSWLKARLITVSFYIGDIESIYYARYNGTLRKDLQPIWKASSDNTIVSIASDAKILSQHANAFLRKVFLVVVKYYQPQPKHNREYAHPHDDVEC